MTMRSPCYSWSFQNCLKFVVVRNAKRLNPEIICITPEKGTKFFKSLVDNLVQLD